MVDARIRLTIRSLPDDHLVKRKLKTIRIVEKEGMYSTRVFVFCTVHLQTKRMPQSGASSLREVGCNVQRTRIEKEYWEGQED
jgi:hypothetical protein